MTLSLRWGLPIRPLVLQWATPAGALIPPPTERDLPALAVVVGPPGDAGAGSQLTRNAGEVIGALKAVAIDGNELAILADKDGAFLPAGLAVNAAALGGTISIALGGDISDAGWNWHPGSVWLGNAGALTQTAPTSGRLVRIGRSAGPKTLIIVIELIANLN